MAKKRKKRTKRKHTPRVRPMPEALLYELEEVDRLTRRKRWPEALEKLQALDQRYRNQPAVLTELVNVCYELDDIRYYQLYIQRLHKITPNDPEVLFGLAGAYLTNLYPALALQTFRRFLDRYPDHERAEKARQALAELESEMKKILADMGASGEDGLALAAQHDEVRACLELGQLREARQAAKRLLDRHPDFVPVLNNLSQVDFREGRLEQAIATAQRVLNLEADNFQALANLTRYLYLSGRTGEARQQAERLKAVESEFPDIWVKKAETFSYLGDDESVLEALRRFEQAGHLETAQASTMLYHLAAVAAMRLGDEKQARQYWQQALKFNPNFGPARDNLADLDQPAYQRHAPWPFRFRQWVSEQAITDMVKYWQPAIRRNSEEAMTRAARRYLKQHPEVEFLIPCLLERGDPDGRKFALDLAKLAETPELLAVLRDFALGQHGPDEARQRALQIVSEAGGLLPAGPVRVWLRGEWQEILTMGFEIHDEPTMKHSPQVTRWMQQAAEALYHNNPNEAERLLKQVLEVAPNEPDILNNLGVAYTQQGRHSEAEALVRQIYQDHPDYFFGRIGMANLHLQEGETDQAEALLKPLLSRKRLHITEFAALCMANIQLYLVKDMPEAVQTWLDMWADIDPDNPDLHYWQRQLRRPGKAKKPGWRKRLGL